MGLRLKHLYYAVGDIHGRDDLLEALHECITAYHALRYKNVAATIVYLGDYIDRGANSLDVIDRGRRGLAGFQTICLKGNHEDLLLTCLKTDNRQSWYTWLGNGGGETLISLGIELRFGGYDPAQLAQALGEERIAWLNALQLYHRWGDYLFVHAGIVPAKPIEAQEPKDLLWIRNRFLDYEGDYGFRVIHGHTPNDEPVIRPNRICIDTGATSNGKLTAAVLCENAKPVFLSIEGVAGKGPAKS